MRKKLTFPIQWENPEWSRLWQFNLHYFDWAKFWLEDAIKLKNKKNKLILIQRLIDDWIKNNSIGTGDAWNSYTTSLRIRNWILIFRLCPDMLSHERKKFIVASNMLVKFTQKNIVMEEIT